MNSKVIDRFEMKNNAKRAKTEFRASALDLK